MPAVLSRLIDSLPTFKQASPAIFGISTFLFVVNAYKRNHGLG